jgi:hypothetical protein
MHRDHDNDRSGGDGVSAGGRAPRPPGPGHNRATAAKPVAQWQTPHRPSGPAPEPPSGGEPDLDLVEAAFTEAFAAAGDPTSFLRLAAVPFEAVAADGKRLALLRVEIDDVADVGAITPHLGGSTFRYDPLPARMVSKRRRLRFIYFDGEALRPLTLDEARRLR